jgi:hypothetical protein
MGQRDQPQWTSLYSFRHDQVRKGGCTCGRRIVLFAKNRWKRKILPTQSPVHAETTSGSENAQVVDFSQADN